MYPRCDVTWSSALFGTSTSSSTYYKIKYITYINHMIIFFLCFLTGGFIKEVLQTKLSPTIIREVQHKMSSRGSQIHTNVSCGCFLNEKLFYFSQCVELLSFSLWPLNFYYIIVLLAGNVNARIISEDIDQVVRVYSSQLFCFLLVLI